MDWLAYVGTNQKQECCHQCPHSRVVLKDIREGNSSRRAALSTSNLAIGTSLVIQWLRLCLPMQGGAGSILGWGAKIPHASGPKNQNIKQKQYCNIFSEDFKNGPHQKILKKKPGRQLCIDREVA